MYLRALEIQGFKSFPDKTVLNFGEDITAIVGPNGSGKSNISDAIRWVMGEQNSRQLRGAKMEDVIFGGTEKRSQMGFAQVTLVIDNTEHIFPGRDEAEVAVTRRYYRSGESEYYINRQSVRLKDVNELFMDTGMGREGYSIIGQGKIDEILSVKSGERREVFEEAAGISKYRHRKEESERKLQRTEENLVRINDKIAELELQVEPLRKQAETAKKYLVLRDELRVLEISVWLENLQALKVKARKLEADHQSACQDKQRAQAALDEVYAAAETCVEQVQQNDMQAEALRGRMSGLETAAGEEDAAIAVLQTGVDHNQESMTRLEREMADSSSRTEDLQGQMDALTRRTEEIDRRTQELTGELEGWMQQLQSMTQRAGSAVREAEVLRAREALATAAAADGRAQLSGLEAQSQAARTRLEEVGRELEQLQERRQTEESAAAENRKALEEAREEAAAAENVIQGHGLKMGGRQRRAQESAQQREQLSRQAAAMEDRIRLLTEMEKEYEGFSRAVKLVMQAADKGGLRGVHGPVASLMTTQEQYTVAVEIALGGALQNIVVDTQNDAKSAIGYLKQRDGGRATFLPLDAVRGEKLRESRIEEEYGFVGVASELVQYEKRYDGVFQNLLGRTVVVEDLDCGVTMARRYQNRFRIVTLDGQVINRGGSMTGGSVSRSAGVLSRANELQRLAGQLEQLRGQLADADRRAQETGRELQKAQYELDVAKEQQRAAAQQVLTLEGRQEHHEILLENLRLSQDGLQQERETLTRRLQEQETQMQAVRQEIAAHEGEAERLSRQAEESRAGQSDLQTRTDEISGQITEHKTALAALAAERGTSLHSRRELERLQVQMHTDRAGREALLERFRRSNEEAGREMDIHRQKAEELRTQCRQLKEQLASLAAEKLELERRRTQQNQEMQRCNEEVLHTEREVARLEQQKNAAAMEEKNILDKLWERYELSHSEAQSQRMELESIPKATRRIGELNRVLGGGIVPGSMILLGGEPGIGKSTLVLQFALHNRCGKVLYVSGEESVSQIKMRAQRLGAENDDCLFLSGNSLETVLEHSRALEPKLLIIDSIQTLATESVDAIPGSLSQIRECTNVLLRYSKENTITTILIGHITKDGQLAGPKILEHMVDTVLQFEGDQQHMYRILRSMKNRFGSTSEIGIYEMLQSGLRQVANPSELLLSNHDQDLSGVAVSATMEGVRTILLEVQALVSTAAYGTPQRSATGFDMKVIDKIKNLVE